jgi:hypothetical protein
VKDGGQSAGKRGRQNQVGGELSLVAKKTVDSNTGAVGSVSKTVFLKTNVASAGKSATASPDSKKVPNSVNKAVATIPTASKGNLNGFDKNLLTKFVTEATLRLATANTKLQSHARHASGKPTNSSDTIGLSPDKTATLNKQRRVTLEEYNIETQACQVSAETSGARYLAGLQEASLAERFLESSNRSKLAGSLLPQTSQPSNAESGLKKQNVQRSSSICSVGTSSSAHSNSIPLLATEPQSTTAVKRRSDEAKAVQPAVKMLKMSTSNTLNQVSHEEAATVASPADVLRSPAQVSLSQGECSTTNTPSSCVNVDSAVGSLQSSTDAMPNITMQKELTKTSATATSEVVVKSAVVGQDHGKSQATLASSNSEKQLPMNLNAAEHFAERSCCHGLDRASDGTR